MKRNSALRRLAALLGLAVGVSAFVAKNAMADVTLWKPEKGEDGWEIFTNGRVGVFFSYARGDGLPQGKTFGDPVLTPMIPGMACDPVTNPCTWQSPELHSVKNGAGGLNYEGQQEYPVPNPDGTPSPRIVSAVNHWRLRSGFAGNVFGFGVRRQLTPTTKVTGYVSFTAIVDAHGQKQVPATLPAAAPDAREGYLKLEGPWGGLLIGRTGTLFNRGAVVTDFLYLHGYGVGFPGDLSTAGNFPTAGQIGFGVLANGFAAGFVYSTPEIFGAQLNLALLDPSNMTGSSVERSKEPRTEFELTVNEPIGTIGKFHAYLNGGYQKHYRPQKTDDNPETSKGYGYGTRIELGPAHLGVGGHRGTGITMTYHGIPGEAAYNDSTQFRDTSGFFVIGQLALGKIDISGAYGQSKVQVLDDDRVSYPGNPVNPATGIPDPQFSWIASQTGISAAVVYHISDWLHVDVDAMFTTSKWNLGEQQKINFYNAGTTITW